MTSEIGSKSRSPNTGLYVKKRNGILEHVNFNKITNRIKYLVEGVTRDGSYIGKPLSISYDEIIRDIITTIKNEITTVELDEYAARLCASKRHIDEEYAILSARIAVSNHHKNTIGNYADTMKIMYNSIDEVGDNAPLITEALYHYTQENRDILESYIDYARDYNLDYFGQMTIVGSYLMRGHTTSASIQERMQHLYMRVAVALHMPDYDKIKETYDALSKDGGYLSHATPTLYNAGTPLGQLASCFLMGTKDSIDEKTGIGALWGNTAKISKRAGGIGISLTNIRGTNSRIRGTNGKSDGIIPLCKVLNDISRYVNQGGKRKGSFAIYLEPWHTDIEAFLDLRKNHGDEDARARDLFTAMWMPDLFMKRLEQSITTGLPVAWSLMCPDASHIKTDKRLCDIHSEEFEALYEKYEKLGLVKKVIPDIRTLWFKILTAQQETGTPYLLFKDSINRKNNQSNLGTIKSSNLCAEIVEYSDDSEHAVCNLASIPLQRFVKESVFDHVSLLNIAKIALRNLDRIIDITYYPTKETKKSNRSHRPVGLGVQGLADTFIMLCMPFDSPDAAILNRDIFETIYFACMTESMNIARERHIFIMEYLKTNDVNDIIYESKYEHAIATNMPGKYKFTRAELSRDSHWGSYSSFIGSPLHSGKFQFDLWETDMSTSSRDWESLRKDIMQYGVRNSLTTAIMPTASTAIIYKSIECIEPIKSNIYTRRTLNGEFVVYNNYLQADLKKLNLWDESMQRQIIANRGSIQAIPEIPANIKALYRTAYELKQKVIIDLARGRSPFIDQTQSMNLFFQAPNNTLLTNCFMYGWKSGLKTGVYYIRRQAAVNAIQFTVEAKEECLSCSA